MKKKWLSVLALSMSICTTVTTFAGCDFGNMFGGGKLTEDQIYEKVVEAKEATENYKGAMTMTRKEKTIYTQGIFRSEHTVSVDPATNRYYEKTVSSNNESSWDYESVSKAFKQNDTYYLYEKSSTKDVYYSISAADAKERVENTFISTTIDEFDDYIKEISSIKEMNDAYAEVVADSKALVASYYEPQVLEIDASVLYECKQKQNSCVFKKTNMKYIAEGAAGRRVVNEVEFTVGNGLITEITTYHKEIYKRYETADRKMEIEEDEDFAETKTTYTFKYKFAKDDYNAFTTAPSNVQTRKPLAYTRRYTKALELNGVLFDNERPFSDYGFDVLLENILNDAGYLGVDITWYTDKACTKPLTTTITEEEFEKLDTLYGQATVQENYYAAVLCIEEGAYASDVNDNYKLVFEELENAMGSVATRFEENPIYTISKQTNTTVYVNDVEVVFAEGETSKDIPLTKGQICVVKYVKTYEKRELNLMNKSKWFDF